MHNTLRNFIVIFILAGLSSVSAQKERAYFDEMNALAKQTKINYPGDSNIDVTFYGLDLFFDYPSEFISGSVIVRGTAETALNSFYLDLHDNMTVDSVTSGGARLTFVHQNGKLTITPPSALNPGETFDITVYYHGSPVTTGLNSIAFSSHNGEPEISTLSEPYGASDWWPVKDTPADKADSSWVKITADSYFISVSNGLLQSVTDNGDGTTTYFWKNSYPIAQYLISVAMTNYSLYTNYFYRSDNDSMQIDHYNYPENFNATRKYFLDMTPQMIEVFSELYGEYPFIKEKYGHAEFDWGGAMEHQTVSSMGFYDEGVIAHELAHQWFGDKITCATWNEIWLNEGFATYSEGLYIEAVRGRQDYLGFIDDITGDPSQYWKAKGARYPVYVSDISSVYRIFDNGATYHKGAMILHMLRGVVGDEHFFDILYTYANKPELAYSTATLEDFIGVAEEVSGMDLDYFFDEWLYGLSYPVYSVDWEYSANLTGGYEINVTVTQEVRPDPAYFTMPVDIKILTTGADTTFTVFNDAQVETFTFKVENEPSGVVFDPDNWIMKDMGTQSDIEDGKTAPKDYTLFQNYPNPFNPETTIQYFIPEKGNVAIKLYDALGSEVATLVNESAEKGKYFYKLNASELGLSSGVYIYTISVNDFKASRKLVLMK